MFMQIIMQTSVLQKPTPSAPNDIEENLPISVDGERLSKPVRQLRCS